MRRMKLLWIVWGCLCTMGAWGFAEEAFIREPSQVLEVERGAHPSKPPVITAVAVVPGGGLVATAGDDHVVRLWSTTTGRIVQTLKGHRDWVRSLAFSPDGQSLASAGDDRQVILWQVSSGKLLSQLSPHPHSVYTIAYSPDGTLLAAAGFEHSVRLYDMKTNLLARELLGPCGDLRSVAFSPDGKQLAAGGRNGQIHVWDVASGTTRLEIAAGLGRLRTLAYLPDGDKIVSAGEGRTIFIWDAQTGEEVYQFVCPSAKVLSMAVCGENLIATGGSDNLVRVWNWQTQTEHDRLPGHTGSVASLAYDPASGVIISGSYDTTVRVWKIKTVGGGKDTASPTNTESRVR